MRNSLFFYFLTLNLFSQKRKNLTVVLLSIVLIFLLSSTLFISSSLQASLRHSLNAESDFVVQRVRGGHLLPTPTSWVDEISNINGVSKVSPRVWGRYYTKPKGKSFLIVGVDFLDEQAQRDLAKIILDTNLREFLSGKYMIVGSSVAKWLKSHFYEDSYNFLNPNGDFIKLKIYSTLPKESSLIGGDLVIVPIDVAREILGLSENEATDITFNVPNDSEWANIEAKISSLHYDLRVISKSETQSAYDKLFNYKGGFFLILFLIVLLTFALVLYQRASQVFSSERRYIGILRALGWSIKDILKLKFLESLIVVITSFILGSSLAYFYTFNLGAPILKGIFLGANGDYPLVPMLDFSTLFSIFLLYLVTFMSAILIPTWQVAITDPKEAML